MMSIEYQKLVKRIKAMLKQDIDEGLIYEQLEDENFWSPDSLHLAICEAQEELK